MNSDLEEDNISDSSEESNNSTYIQMYGEDDLVSSSYNCAIRLSYVCSCQIPVATVACTVAS